MKYSGGLGCVAIATADYILVVTS